MNKRKSNLKNMKKNVCAVCGKTLRYDFEIRNGICETCEIGMNQQGNKKSKVKNFKEFSKKN